MLYFSSSCVDVPGLQVAPFVDALQREAQRALKEVLFLLHDDGSFGRVLLAASSLQSITPELITELFFRPIMGSSTHLLHLISDILLHTDSALRGGGSWS